MPRGNRGESVVLYGEGWLAGPSGQQADEVIGIAMVLGLPVRQGSFASPTPALTFVALSLAQRLPPCGLVTGASKPLRIDKRLHQQNPMAKSFFPVTGQPLTDQLENPGGHVGPTPRGRKDHLGDVENVLPFPVP